MAKKVIDDFLSAASTPVTEVIELAGFRVEVRGLTIGELEQARKPLVDKQKDPLEITADLIADCCYNADTGESLIPEDRRSEILKMNPQMFKKLNEAISRVNGFSAGNSKATDTEDSSSE
jgi:hypothetical protein